MTLNSIWRRQHIHRRNPDAPSAAVTSTFRPKKDAPACNSRAGGRRGWRTGIGIGWVGRGRGRRRRQRGHDADGRRAHCEVDACFQARLLSSFLPLRRLIILSICEGGSALSPHLPARNLTFPRVILSRARRSREANYAAPENEDAWWCCSNELPLHVSLGLGEYDCMPYPPPTPPYSKNNFWCFHPVRKSAIEFVLPFLSDSLHVLDSNPLFFSHLIVRKLLKK